MRIRNLIVENFCSYERLIMTFDNLGLALLHGKTGSGKSTILDAVCWCLYGVTAKGTPSDGVRPINGDKGLTIGIIEVETPSGEIRIFRERMAGKNDLRWYNAGDYSTAIRGKDLTETQQLLSERLGVDADTFIAASYYHEFSPTGAFFTAKAKERRELFEQLANLDLPNKLAEISAENKRRLKDQINKSEMDKERGVGKADQLQAQHLSAIRNVTNWEKERAKTVVELEKLHTNFEENKLLETTTLEQAVSGLQKDLFQSLHDLKDLKEKSYNHLDTCDKCGTSLNNPYTRKIQQLEWDLNMDKQKLQNVKENLKVTQNSKNHYEVQIVREKSRINPWHEEQEKIAADIVKHTDHMKLVNKNLKGLYDQFSSFKLLYDLSALLRGELLKKVVSEVQDATNAYLEKYFDSEIRVAFILQSDSLEATVQKNGFECSYKQLSKGQRGLLKLCFSVAVQEAVSNNKGIHFANLFFDEALDGYDEDLKIKSFRLFEDLSLTHESVMVIDHNQSFQQMFHKSFEVTMEEDKSKLEER